MDRSFSEDEANALLPRLRDLMTALRAALVKLDADRQQAGAQAASNGSPHIAVQGSQSAGAVDAAVAEIEALGVVVRDPASGLVDFPAERDGEPVFLCWRIEEERVAHWHPRDAGFAGRRPL